MLNQFPDVGISKNKHHSSFINIPENTAIKSTKNILPEKIEQMYIKISSVGMLACIENSGYASLTPMGQISANKIDACDHMLRKQKSPCANPEVL